MARERDEEDEGEELADVEVERMPNLDGWEFFKAIQAGDGSERWTLALKHAADRGEIEYAFWTDSKADPAANGKLEASQEPDKRWAKSVRKAVQSRAEGGLDTEARADVILAILRRHDESLESYEERLLFTLEPPSDEPDEDDESNDEDANDV